MAAADGNAEFAVKLLDQMKAEPWRFDFYHVLRQLERLGARVFEKYVMPLHSLIRI